LFALPIWGATTALIAGMGNARLISSAEAAPAALSKAQADALETYNNAVAQFRSVLNERRDGATQRQCEQEPDDHARRKPRCRNGPSPC